MPALSLSELCKKSAAKNVKSKFEIGFYSLKCELIPSLGLLDVGDLPYNVLRPILMKIDDARQLVRKLSSPPPPAASYPAIKNIYLQLTFLGRDHSNWNRLKSGVLTARSGPSWSSAMWPTGRKGRTKPQNPKTGTSSIISSWMMSRPKLNETPKSSRHGSKTSNRPANNRSRWKQQKSHLCPRWAVWNSSGTHAQPRKSPTPSLLSPLTVTSNQKACPAGPCLKESSAKSVKSPILGITLDWPCLLTNCPSGRQKFSSRLRR